MQKLVRTLNFKNGMLYCITGGRRMLLAQCRPVVDIIEHSSKIKAISMNGYQVKTIRIAVVLCPEPETTMDVDTEFFQKIAAFELSADIQRADGLVETVNFNRLIPEEINLAGDWKFEVQGPQEFIKKLLAL